MNLLSIHNFVQLCIGYLENIGSLNFKQFFRISIHYMLSKLSFLNITTNVIIRKKFLSPLGRVFQNSNFHLKVQLVSLATKISVDFLKLYVFFINIWHNDLQSCKFLLVIFPKKTDVLWKQTYKHLLQLVQLATETITQVLSPEIITVF